MRGVVQVTPWAAGMFLVPARPPLRPGCPPAEISEGPLGGLSVLPGRRASYGLASRSARDAAGCRGAIQRARVGWRRPSATPDFGTPARRGSLPSPAWG
jgi:hypothetical protein